MDSDRPAWRSRAWVAAGAVLALVTVALTTTGWAGATELWLGLAVAGAVGAAALTWATVRTRAQRRTYEEELAAWAAERATQAERLRIARDLHDVVSHGLGLITVRAAAARRVTGADGDAERATALADIERAGRATTTELRRLLSVLRTPGTEAPLAPAATLTDLPDVAQQATAAGLTTALEVDVDAADVSPGAQVTVCAVVREALANTLRHAGPTTASVAVRREGDVVVVDVRDAGPVPQWVAQPGAGHGLAGLRERVAALGGELHAAPEGEGYRVTARLPEARR